VASKNQQQNFISKKQQQMALGHTAKLAAKKRRRHTEAQRRAEPNHATGTQGGATKTASFYARSTEIGGVSGRRTTPKRDGLKTQGTKLVILRRLRLGGY